MSDQPSLAATAAESAAKYSLKRSRILFDHGNPSDVFVPSVLVHPELAVKRRSRLPQDAKDKQQMQSQITKKTQASFTSTAASALTLYNQNNDEGQAASATTLIADAADENRIIQRSSANSASNTNVPTPNWHAPWKLATVLSSHLGWVRCLAVDQTSNELLASGSADRTIKIWNLPKATVGASDALQLTLTGHISAIRGLEFSQKHPYLFSAAEDKKVLCWDLHTNQVVRHYHGHLSGVYCLQLHPSLDLLVTGGRDAVARVWDMRTKQAVQILAGHSNTVGALLVHATHPQIVTGSHDTTIKLWDMVAGKTVTTLTHHNKSVRALASAASARLENTFVSGASDALRKWQCKDGKYLQKMTDHGGSIVSSLALNEDGVMVSGTDDGALKFYDYSSGHCFQSVQSQVQPGSLEAENGIMALQYDATGTRLLTGECDKTIKIYKQSEDASEMTHPIDMAAWRKKCLREAKERY
ncbi:hypothetical protein MPSEU_000751800 [Mayamaea pseudoterrestris]|nr:hypothetical protein MPSEU_000751800 [Mayamaea pseudoterrestris]